MSLRKLHRCLADQLQHFLELRRLAGTDYHSQAQLLGYFDRFLDEQGVGEPQITREITDAYQQSLGHLRPRTRDNRYGVVRQFCEYLSRSDPRCYVPERQRGTRSQDARPRHIYSVSEVQSLLAAAAQLPPANSLRPHTYLLGKGRKHRSCPLWPETAQALRAYLQQRASQESSVEPLFLNAHSLALTRFGLRYIVRKYVAQGQTACPSLIGKRVSPHTIRHTTAMHLLRSGNEVNMVSYWLGHADINTTHVYVEIDMETKRQMLQKAPAPAVHHARPWRKPGILEWLTNLVRAPQLCGVRHQSKEHNQPGPAE